MLQLPINSLDFLIDTLGGPSAVAELTGRSKRIVRLKNGLLSFEPRSEQLLKEMNVIEKKRFMEGEKLIAIISDASSTGISLHSSNTAENKRRRIHVTLELPWSAEKAIQQMGRTHRSNQANAPHFINLVSDLAGEARFAVTLSKRLESMGALLHADRRAAETSNFGKYNLDNKFGLEAIRNVVSSFKGEVEGSPITEHNHIKNALINVEINTDDSKPITVNRFLNRMLGMPVQLQNNLYKMVIGELEVIINREKRAGNYDMGITGRS